MMQSRSQYQFPKHHFLPIQFKDVFICGTKNFTKLSDMGHIRTMYGFDTG